MKPQIYSIKRNTSTHPSVAIWPWYIDKRRADGSWYMLSRADTFEEAVELIYKWHRILNPSWNPLPALPFGLELIP